MAELFFRKKRKGEVERGPGWGVCCALHSCGSGSIGFEKGDLVTEI